MTTFKTILAAAIGIALATAAGTAVGATQDDDDSVYSWGPWAKMVSPAAGPQGVGFLDLGGLSEYRPDVVIETGDEGLCAAGSTCGFATYKPFHHHKGRYDGGQIPTLYLLASDGGEGGSVKVRWNGYYPGLFDFNGTADSPHHLTDVTFDVTALNTGEFPDVSSVVMEGGYGGWYPVHFGASGFDSGQFSSISGIYNPWLEVMIGSDQKGFGEGWQDGTCTRCGISGAEGAFVWGVTPTIAALQTNLGGISAHYGGFSLYGGQHVNIDVQLTAGTWNGSWSHGHTSTAFAFDATGTITGVNLTSTGLSGPSYDEKDSSTYTGSVNGAFFGTNGQTIAGVADVTKTTTYCGDHTVEVRNVDLFVTSQVPVQQEQTPR